MKVANTNHFDMSRCLRQSPRQNRGQVHDKVADLSPTQIMKVGDAICVADFHNLCLRQVRDFVRNLSRTLLQSRRNGIWTYTIIIIISERVPKSVSRFSSAMTASSRQHWEEFRASQNFHASWYLQPHKH